MSSLVVIIRIVGLISWKVFETKLNDVEGSKLAPSFIEDLFNL